MATDHLTNYNVILAHFWSLENPSIVPRMAQTPREKFGKVLGYLGSDMCKPHSKGFSTNILDPETFSTNILVQRDLGKKIHHVKIYTTVAASRDGNSTRTTGYLTCPSLNRAGLGTPCMGLGGFGIQMQDLLRFGMGTRFV